MEISQINYEVLLGKIPGLTDEQKQAVMPIFTEVEQFAASSTEKKISETFKNTYSELEKGIISAFGIEKKPDDVDLISYTKRAKTEFVKPLIDSAQSEMKQKYEDELKKFPSDFNTRLEQFKAESNVYRLKSEELTGQIKTLEQNHTKEIENISKIEMIKATFPIYNINQDLREVLGETLEQKKTEYAKNLILQGFIPEYDPQRGDVILKGTGEKAMERIILKDEWGKHPYFSKILKIEHQQKGTGAKETKPKQQMDANEVDRLVNEKLRELAANSKISATERGEAIKKYKEQLQNK